MSSQSTIHACPMVTFCATSIWSCIIVSGSHVEACGPAVIATYIRVMDHGTPVFVGQPLVVYCRSVFAAG